MTITERLKQLSVAVAEQNWREFSMRVPAEPDRDADIVIMQAAMLIESRDAEVANLAALGSSYLNRANAAEQECESLRQQLDWVRDILASHGYDGPLGDGCCPLSEWLSERDDLGESLAQVKVKNAVLVADVATLRQQLADLEGANVLNRNALRLKDDKLAHREKQIVRLRDAEHDFRHNKDEWGFISRVTEILADTNDLKEQGK